MNKSWLLIVAIAFCITCAEDPIVGRWERFGDAAAGSVVQVEPIGNTHHAILLAPKGVLVDLGFVANDIKWRDIRPVSPNKWRGQDLIKVPDTSGSVLEAEYKDAYFTLLGEGVLEVRKFVEEEEIGTVQKWRRLR